MKAGNYDGRLEVCPARENRVNPSDPQRPVYLISPSGAVGEEAPVDAALSHLRASGFEPVLDRTALSRSQRFAGTDAQRASVAPLEGFRAA